MEILNVGPESASFGYSDPDDNTRFTRLYLDKGVWAEMGEPYVVTLSVERGDLLNDPDRSML